MSDERVFKNVKPTLFAGGVYRFGVDIYTCRSENNGQCFPLFFQNREIVNYHLENSKIVSVK